MSLLLTLMSDHKINWPTKAKATNITKITHVDVQKRYNKLRRSKRKVYFTMGAPEVNPQDPASWNKEHCVFDLHKYLSGGGYPLMNFWKPGKFPPPQIKHRLPALGNR